MESISPISSARAPFVWVTSIWILSPGQMVSATPPAWPHSAAASPTNATTTAAAPGADRRLVYHVSRASRAICGVNAAMSVPERSR